jgi:hypothetical protein
VTETDDLAATRAVITPVFDAARRAIAEAKSPREYARHYRELTGIASLSRDALADRWRASSGAGALVISFSHNQYSIIYGGVQNCVADEQQACMMFGWTYLHLSPLRPLPMLADLAPAEEFHVIVTLNGDILGATSLANVIDLASVEAARRDVHCVVHHLLGHAPELIEQLFIACNAAECFVWTHDLFTLCPGVVLLRNEASFCGGPPVGSPACEICNYGSERPEHVARIKSFLASTNATLLAPSATILDFWRAHSEMPEVAGFVVPPCRVELEQTMQLPRTGSALRVAFLGAPAYRKGWDTFAAVAARHAGDERYSFFVLGVMDPGAENTTHIHVEVTPRNRHAMIDAISTAGIDVVINWSLCYESFSFTTAEAIAAGAFVIAPRDAGNIWPLIASISVRHGHAADSKYELQALFISGRILELASAADRRRGRMLIGSGAAELMRATRRDGR